MTFYYYPENQSEYSHNHNIYQDYKNIFFVYCIYFLPYLILKTNTYILQKSKRIQSYIHYQLSTSLVSCLILYLLLNDIYSNYLSDNDFLIHEKTHIKLFKIVFISSNLNMLINFDLQFKLKQFLLLLRLYAIYQYIIFDSQYIYLYKIFYSIFLSKSLEFPKKILSSYEKINCHSHISNYDFLMYLNKKFFVIFFNKQFFVSFYILYIIFKNNIDIISFVHIVLFLISYYNNFIHQCIGFVKKVKIIKLDTLIEFE